MSFAILFLLASIVIARFTNAKITDTAQTIQAIGILVAMCMGGVLAHRRLQIFRTFEPHLTISHEVSHRFVSDNYVHIDITATLYNSSKVQVELRQGFYRLQLIAPYSDADIERLYKQVSHAEDDITYTDNQIQWTTLESMEISWKSGELFVEPGESHPETCEFLISKDVKSVMIYTYFYDQRFSQINTGWAATTVYDIK